MLDYRRVVSWNFNKLEETSEDLRLFQRLNTPSKKKQRLIKRTSLCCDPLVRVFHIYILVTSKLILNPYVGLRIIGLRFTFGAVVFRAVISATKNEATAREIPIQ